MSMLQIVMGKGTPDRGAITALSMGLAKAAQELGLIVVSNKASRSCASASRYLSLRDHAGHIWLVRVSDHRLPIRTSQPVPHLNFVSLDGVAGLHEATMFLHRIAMGLAVWFDAADPQHRRDLKRQRRRRA